MSSIAISSAAEMFSPQRVAETSQAKKDTSSFSSMLSGMIEKTNSYQAAANNASQALASGKTDDISKVMVIAEKANITLQTALELRNKALEAYQEVMRTQI